VNRPSKLLRSASRAPAVLGSRRQDDAEANIRAANGPKGELLMQRIIQFAFRNKVKMVSRLRGSDGN